MNKFINRISELASLREAHAKPGAGLFVLYGRRRLGKTTLLRQFCADVPAVYHVADRSTEHEALRLLAQSMSMALREPTLAEASYPDWYALFRAYDRFRKGRKPVLVLDEYQYLCEAQPALSSILQRYWDEHWKHQEVMLVLSGSVTSMMYREALARSSPLYGRRTGQWLLRPLRFSQTMEFVSARSPRELLALWGLTGGVPYYLELAAGYRGFREALTGLVLKKGGALYEESAFLIRDEIATPNTYWSLLQTIGNGVSRISEIAARMGLPANQLTRYLDVLRDMGLVRRDVTVTEANPALSKKGLYQLTDPFLRLWFGCVQPYMSLLELGRAVEVERLMQERLQRHLAWAYEDVCRQHVEDFASVPGIVRVGRYWDRSTELDVAAVDEKGALVFAAECKWTSRPVGLDVVRKLEEAVAKVPGHVPSGVRLGLFSTAGFTPPVAAWAKARDAVLVDGAGLLR
ncbi:MAG: ATP-binding protein [Verrucomicrobia bacterium]|nr:ATP-binding protein [Verrucomicrobiota bacterium]